MVKSKFPGKPSKIVQRSLVRAFSIAVPSCDSSIVSKEVYLGLSVFDQSFGSKDEISSFKGFSSTEVQESFAKKEKFISQVRDKFSQRGISFTPSSCSKHFIATTTLSADQTVPSEPKNEIFKSDVEFPPISCKRERRKCGKMWLLNKKVNRYHSKIQVRHNFKTLNKNSLMRFKHKSSNYLSDKYCRKFVLPSRSVHSSRVIKPNKRFIDTDKNSKSRLLLKNFKTLKYEANTKPHVINATSNSESNDASIVPQGKVIIREARLNITTESAIAGPFSAKKTISFEKDKLKSGVITCGICGAVRCYKYILQTKKFGIYSCEPCRRFILNMIKLSKQSCCEILKCKAENGVGKCVIAGSMCRKSPSDESSMKNTRCHACWLMLCLQKYIMPNALRKTLIKLMPEDIKSFSTCMVSMDLARKPSIYDMENINCTVKNDLENSNDTLKKRLRVNHHFFKACSLNRRLMEKNEITSTKSRVFFFKKNVLNHRVNVKNKWTSESSLKDGSEKELLVPRGPRIKHVCRSASSVLRTSLSTTNELEEEDGSDFSSVSEMNSAKLNDGDDGKTQKHNLINKCFSYDEGSDSTEFSTEHYKARTLQDFCKESSDETDENEDKLISIDFWEAYDPDEVFKTGFPLIGSESTNVRALCFLCGSAGKEKLLYCVSCCEGYHWYCADGPSAFREEAELEKCRVNWVCRKCKVCSTCGERSVRTLISCQRCRSSYHPECLTNKALNKRLFNLERPWVCPSCLKCKSCNISSVFTFVGNVPLCSQCFKLRQKGNYCPLCQGCYQDEDYNVQMMECGVCKCWIHARCEGLSDEKYQILSFLPESIEFVCRLCCQKPPSQWWLAVEDELKAGYLGILKNLCKNKRINELFKESPRRSSICKCIQPQLQQPNVVDDLQPADKDVERPALVLGAAIAKCCLVIDKDDARTGIKDCVSPFNDCVVSPPHAYVSSECDILEKSKDDETLAKSDTVGSCKVCSVVNETRTKINQGLLKVKSNVNSGQYSSLSAFHNDLENAIAQIDEGRLMQTYRDTVKKFFPWFDVERDHCQNHSENYQPEVQLNDATAAFNVENDELNNAFEEERYEHLRCLMAADEYPYENIRMLDVRTCILCKALGEASPIDGGRLIYCGRNEWVHSNCALWSSEVFEEIDGSLQNVHSAISRGRQIRCSLCDKKGASIGCCFKNCGLTYHFVCAQKAQCKFFHNKTIYCKSHDTLPKDQALSLLASEKDFEILRPIYVEMERKKKKFECHANVKLRIGSLLVESLGKIDPHLSDNPKHLIPMYFRCTRLFWSTVKPWKVVQYCIQIKVRYLYKVTPAESEVNYTVDHSTRNQIVQQVVDELVKKICVVDERGLCEANSANGQADLLFPELQDTIYKDLPNDVLNDHTLHDIWNNYDNPNDVDVRKDEEDTNADTDNDEDDDQSGKNNSLIVNLNSNGQEKHNSKPIDLKMDGFIKCKYLRDKNNVVRESFRRNRVNSVDRWSKQIRGRVRWKRNFENSAATAKRRKYENYISPSKLDDALEYYASYENILQLDGMVDIYNEEEPVKCIQCHRTYRTSISFERHLETCNTDFSDYMISSCESDSASSEEDKYCISADMMNSVVNGMVGMTGATTVSELRVSSNICDNTFAAKYPSSMGTTTYTVDNIDKMVPAQPYGGATNLCANVTYNGVYPTYTAATYQDSQLMENGNNGVALQTLLQGEIKQEPLTTVVSSPSINLNTVEPSPMKLNFVTSSNGLVTSKACANYASSPNFAFAGAELSTQPFGVQNIATPTYIIHQPYPKTEFMPTYVAVDNSTLNDTTTYLSQPATTTTLQLQQIPTASVNFQPIMPTILGTIVQPNVVETPTYIVNTGASPASHTFAAAAAPSIMIPNQPMMCGLETVFSNTIMSSSQFLGQSQMSNVGASTMYSTTTTQVFQAAKQMQDFAPAGYIVLNPSSVSSTPTMLHASVPQYSSVTAPMVMHSTKQVAPVVTSRPSDVETYMYVHLNQVPTSAGNVTVNPSSMGMMVERKKKPPLIMKPAKQLTTQAKKSVKIMKVKNNRPVAIEVKDTNPAVCGMKPTIPLIVMPDEKAKKLRIKTTDKAIKLGQPSTLVQPVAAYRMCAPTPPRRSHNNIIQPSPCYKNEIYAGKHNPITSICQSIVPQVAKINSIKCKSEPFNADVGTTSSASLPPFEVKSILCPETSQTPCDVKEGIVSPSLPLARSYLEISCGSEDCVGSAFVNLDSQPTTTSIPNDESTPIELEPLEHQLSVSSSLTQPLSTAFSKPLGEPTAQSVPETTERSPVIATTITAPAQSETERLFDELMRQHLQHERRKKQRAAEIAAPSPSTASAPKMASLPPILSLKVPTSSSMPVLDEGLPVPSESLPSPTQNGPAKLSQLKSKYKPRLQPRLPDKSTADAVTASDENCAAAAAATKKLNKSPEKENKKVLVTGENGNQKSWKTASISFEVNAEDGFSYKTNDLLDLWNKILESVQQSRAKHKLPLLPKNVSMDAESVYGLLGFDNNASKHLLEQLPDAWKCIFYKPVFHKTPLKNGKTTLAENETGCARSEPFASSYKYDMFGWLASRHRKPPKFMMLSDSDIVNGNRRITSPNLPMAMRFRYLKETAKETVGVFRSDIHGRGLFCLRDIDAEEMVIEYAGEVIRSTLTDKREKYYTSKGIGCYMFKIDDRFVVDATMCGNPARFINHSCEPNCYSRIETILGKKHILIFALRRIPKGEELTYDYKFPLEEEDEKIFCHCLSRKCRKYLN